MTFKFHHQAVIMYKHLYFFSFLLLFLNCNNSKLEVKTSNDLIHETSPYLLQHANNPVNWKAWNDKTLSLAKKENKLMIISIGYSACHWCHVMEEESFENDSIAKIMNTNFINIKVDREERPDIDKIYLNAVELMTGSGGWPLNCITLPDGRPIFGGTYFTKDQWSKALKDISQLYEKNPQKIIEYANKLTEGIQNSELIKVNTEKADFKTSTIETALNKWTQYLDYKNGGLIGDTKFPMPSNLQFLMRYAYTNKKDSLKNYIKTTLEKMAYGGIYDQIGGGFSRYSVDKNWRIPHFEKMLYDNAQLVSLYSKAYLAENKDLYKVITIETLDFIERELTDTNGGFYSSIDADSKNEKNELEEGIFYSWTKDELKLLLESDFNLFASYYNINNYGKWEKNNYVLTKTKSDIDFAKLNNLSITQLQTKVLAWKKTLFNHRKKRQSPRLDDKMLTSWNALMLKAYVNAYQVFGNKKYLDTALKNADFLINNQLRNDGGLNHSYRNGKSTIDGYTEDYATVIDAFITLYQVTLNEKWLNTAKNLADYTISNFIEQKNKLFYYTNNKAKNIIARKVEIHDGVIPSSNSIMANNLFKLGHYYSIKDYIVTSQEMLNNMNKNISASPSAYSNWLMLMYNFTDPFYEVAISGTDAQEKIRKLNTHYLPNILIAGATKESNIPLMQNRYNPDNTYIYICVNGTCKLPITSTSEVISKLKLY
ncbi:thioredoxin domain-containing protein [uncultured Lacinutrix sp.]|uniref:thioredoxin domain-containing protein n=1 Tax=uncultured Lacinutrix sp. TaxID=574032 RepID=UPI002638D260|nr:thioredoxin domain-containing protein [uncultured Lacinutrix sp.]